MIYAFSSGASRLYLKDVFRVLSMPKGFIIKFRYFKRWVDSSLLTEKNELSDNIVGEATLISFVDNSVGWAPSEKHILIPVREAKVHAVDTVAEDEHDIYFELRDLVFLDQAKHADFYSELAEICGGNNIPYRTVEDNDRFKVEGKFLSKGRQASVTLEKGKDETIFRKQVDYLQSNPFFMAYQKYFYKVLGIYQFDSDEPIAVNKLQRHQNGYKVVGGDVYRIDFYCYQSEQLEHQEGGIFARLALHGDQNVNLYEQNVLEIDSRYDKKSVHFNPRDLDEDSLSFINLKLSHGKGDAEVSSSEFMIPLLITHKRLAKWINFFAFVILLSAGYLSAQAQIEISLQWRMVLGLLGAAGPAFLLYIKKFK